MVFSFKGQQIRVLQEAAHLLEELNPKKLVHHFRQSLCNNQILDDRSVVDHHSKFYHHHAHSLDEN